MGHGLYDAKVELEDKVHKRKVVDLGPIMLDAERCVLCTRCIRFEREVTGTNSFELVNRGDHTSIATYENRPITHGYAGNLADVCPVGALLSHDFRFKMRVWFLKPHDSVCPGCSTGCNVFVDERDGEVQRLRPRRNPEVNKSWMCDVGRYSYKEIGLDHARLRSPGQGPEPGRAWPLPGPRHGRGAPQGGGRGLRASWPRRRERTRTSSSSARWRRRSAPSSTSAWATHSSSCASAPTTCSCARTATRTRRAASTWDSAGRGSPRSSKPAARDR